MQPTLNALDEKKSDFVYVNIYDKNYSYKDIVVIDVDWDEEPIIKRIVGLPGDIIDIVYDNNTWKLERNGVIIDEDYIYDDNDPSMPTSQKNGNYRSNERLEELEKTNPELFVDGKYIVKENEVFVLGDHRVVSVDSSRYGAFAFDKITGKVELIRYNDDNMFRFYFDYIIDGKFVYTLLNMFSK
jgi:signal peptidase I